jgi:hypothetical protein
MADNLSDRFAKMSEDERRRFALEQDGARAEGDDQPPDELAFENPRNDPGRTKANLEDRDGAAALLDEPQHDDRVREETRDREKQDRPPR